METKKEWVCEMKPYFASVLICVLLTACYAHLDKITRFKINAELYDVSTNKPIEDVQCFFEDTGYDEVRSVKNIDALIGTTDRIGLIQDEFNLMWGINQGPFSQKPKRTFSIKFKKEKYKTQVIGYSDEKLLKDDDGYYIVNIGKVKLEPEKINEK
jgi:hypothetical protein